MNRMLIAVALAVGLVMPAMAQDDHEVQCGNGWVSFVLDPDDGAYLTWLVIRESAIDRALAHIIDGHASFGVIVAKVGHGTAEYERHVMRMDTFRQIVSCLLD